MLVWPHLYFEIHEDILLSNLAEDVFCGFVVVALFYFHLIQGDLKTTPLTPPPFLYYTILYHIILY